MRWVQLSTKWTSLRTVQPTGTDEVGCRPGMLVLRGSTYTSLYEYSTVGHNKLYNFSSSYMRGLFQHICIVIFAAAVPRVRL